MADRIRLYKSALNDVRYVYGHPIRFSVKAEDVARRENTKKSAIDASEAAMAARAKAEPAREQADA